MSFIQYTYFAFPSNAFNLEVIVSGTVSYRDHGKEMLTLETSNSVKSMVNRLGGWEAMASLTEANHQEQAPINTHGGSW